MEKNRGFLLTVGWEERGRVSRATLKEWEGDAANQRWIESQSSFEEPTKVLSFLLRAGHQVSLSPTF